MVIFSVKCQWRFNPFALFDSHLGFLKHVKKYYNRKNVPYLSGQYANFLVLRFLHVMSEQRM